MSEVAKQKGVLRGIVLSSAGADSSVSSLVKRGLMERTGPAGTYF